MTPLSLKWVRTSPRKAELLQLFPFHFPTSHFLHHAHSEFTMFQVSPPPNARPSFVAEPPGQKEHITIANHSSITITAIKGCPRPRRYRGARPLA